MRSTGDISCGACGFNGVNSELIKSLQKLASTMAGESSLAGSERISIGSKLKESKMSTTSFSTIGFDHSGGYHARNPNKNNATLNKYNSTRDLKSLGNEGLKM